MGWGCTRIGCLGKYLGLRGTKLHKEELYDLYCPPYVTRMIKSRRMRCDGHVERMGENWCMQDFGGET
jgi:hypothetical protein